MRYLAIDYGEKRTGIAIGDDETGHVAPVTTIISGDSTQRLRELEKLIDTYGPDALIVGLPLNMDGSTGPAALQVQRFTEQLRTRTGLSVHEIDERLTSFAADEQMTQSGLKLTRGKKKQHRDALAAAQILRDFLASRK